MKRVLCVALLAAAASSVPASAAYQFVHVYDNQYGRGVSTSIPGQPLVGVHQSYMNGTTCVTVSEMVPQCIAPIE